MEKNHQTVECKGCGFQIVWVKTKAGKNMPCDPELVKVVTEDGDVVTGRVSHFATCPNADDFRKPKKE